MKLTDTFREHPGVYIITNIKNGKYYVGESLNIKKRIYKHTVGNSLIIHKAFRKHGLENFEVYVEYFTAADKQFLLRMEEQLIERFNSLSPNGYNICEVGRSRFGVPMSEESKQKISKFFKGRKRSEQSVIKSALSKTGQKRTDEQKRKMSEAKIGKRRPPHTPETIEKMRNAAKRRYSK